MTVTHRHIICTMLLLLSFPHLHADSGMDRFIDELLRKMTLEEKIGQLSQFADGYSTGPDNTRISREPMIEAGQIGSLLGVTGTAETRKFQEAAMRSRLGIPLLFGMDVIHGYRTGFPIPLGEAASFDLEAIGESARCSAREAAASGIHWTFAPMVDICWDARWGRIMEGAGEDPYYGAKVASARVHGLQGDNPGDTATILSCVKHFAGYGAPRAGIDYNSVDMSWGQLANFYLPPYKAGAEAGAATFMSAFQDIDNIPCTANRTLLSEILRDKWNFKGFVVSDWGSVKELVNHRVAADERDAARMAISAGLDMDMCGSCYSDHLAGLVRDGEIPVSVVDQAVRRVLEQKYKLGLFQDPFRYCDAGRERREVGSAESHKYALKMAERSIVLLKNEGNVLPLSTDIRRIALVGPLANSKRDMCGGWTCADVGWTVTPCDALKSRGYDVDHTEGYNMETGEMVDLDKTLESARNADAVIVAIGERQSDTGEMASRADIEVAAGQQKLVTELLKTGKPVVVLLMCGRPVIFNTVRDKAPAILCTWWLGTEAGNAIANVVFGDYNPSGKLPVSFPRHIGQLPLTYLAKSTGRPTENGGWSTRYRDISMKPAFPFGHGLSYTTFSYSKPELRNSDKPGVHAEVAVDVTNTGKTAGEEVVQLYVRDEVASVTRPMKELRGFHKISLKPGERKTVVFQITDEQLGFYDNNMDYRVEKGDFTFMTGPDSENLDTVSFTLR